MTKNPTILAIDSTGHFSSAGIFDKIGNEFLLTSYDCNFKDTNSELKRKSISSLVVLYPQNIPRVPPVSCSGDVVVTFTH